MNDAAFFASIRASLFNGTFTQTQVDGINRLLKVWWEQRWALQFSPPGTE